MDPFINMNFPEMIYYDDYLPKKREADEENQMPPYHEKIKIPKSKKKLLKKITPKNTSDLSSLSPYKKENANEPNKVISSIDREFEKISELLKSDKSENEKKKGLGIFAETVLQRIPLTIEKMEQGKKDISIRLFDEVIRSLKKHPALEPYAQGIQLLASNLLGIKAHQKIKQCEMMIEELEKKNNKNEIFKWQMTIENLKNSTRNFCDINLDAFEPIAASKLKKVAKKVTEILPKGGETFDFALEAFGAPIYQILKFGSLVFITQQINKATLLLDYMSLALENEKESLKRDRNSDTQEKRKKIKLIEKEISQLKKQLFVENIKSFAYNIRTLAGIVNLVTNVLPEGQGVDVFKLMVNALETGSKAAVLVLPGNAVLQRVNHIKTHQKNNAELENSCKKLEKEIESADQGQQEIEAKKLLLVILRIKQNIIKNNLIPMQIWMLIEDFTSFGRWGKKFTNDFLQLLGIQGSIFNITGQLGVAFTLTGAIFKLGRFLLTDRAALSKWKGKFEIYQEDRKLKHHFQDFQSWAENFSKEIFPLNRGSRMASDTIKENLKKEKKSLKKELEEYDQLLLIAPLEELSTIVDHLSLIKEKIEILKKVNKSIPSGQELAPQDLIKLKNELFQKLGMTEFLHLTSHKMKLEEKKNELEKLYKERRKYEQHLWKAQAYKKFKHELEKTLKNENVYREFSNYMKTTQPEFAENIFPENESVDIESLMDFIFPDIK